MSLLLHWHLAVLKQLASHVIQPAGASSRDRNKTTLGGKKKKKKVHNEVEIESQNVFWHWRIRLAELFIFTSALVFVVVVVYLAGTCSCRRLYVSIQCFVAQGGFSHADTLVLSLLQFGGHNNWPPWNKENSQDWRGSGRPGWRERRRGRVRLWEQEAKFKS